MTLLEALISIRDNGPAHRTVGICSNVDIITGSSQNLHSLFSAYPNFTGSEDWPLVDSGTYYSDRENYSLWEGEGLKIRMNFINFAIERLNNEEI